MSNPSQTHHFRPINLYSTIYKTISKILVSRLQPLLDKLVSPFQSLFIPERSMHDESLLTHEILHKFKNQKSKSALITIKLDMENVGPILAS